MTRYSKGPKTEFENREGKFILVTGPQMQWFPGQPIAYKAVCPECKVRPVYAITSFEPALKNRCSWPPEDFLCLCQHCDGIDSAFSEMQHEVEPDLEYDDKKELGLC